MSRPMSDLRKHWRFLARFEGKKAIQAIHRSIWPVYDGDETRWEELAVAYARRAWTHAVNSEQEGKRA